MVPTECRDFGAPADARRQYRDRVSRSDRVAAALLEEVPRGTGAVAIRSGDATIVGVEPVETVIAQGTEGLAVLDTLREGFWAGFLSFELGHALERVVPRGAALDVAAVPDVAFARFDARALIAPDGTITLEGGGPGRMLLEHARRAAAHACTSPSPRAAARDRDRDAAWRSSLDREQYAAHVHEILELLRAGDCYQVNLTRRLTLDHALDPVDLFGALATHHPAPHTALLRLDIDGEQVAVVSASPELFLRRRGADVETRPIKGTSASAARLRRSAKDHAENVMIVDLARNDLGRVCTPGTISVPTLCAVEAHPGLHHLVSTVQGRLRDDVGLGALVRATFPPASVTGAPKPRVLQAIEDLEPVRRGVYCGAVGWIDTTRDAAEFAVAIRTFTILGHGPTGSTHLGVGGGIVADSRPDAEWAETELKAARLLAVASEQAQTHSDAAMLVGT
jgi:para-aminobenzoate synthetase component 1